MSSATRVPGFSFALSTFVRQPTTYRGPLLAFTMTAGATRRFQTQAHHRHVSMMIPAQADASNARGRASINIQLESLRLKELTAHCTDATGCSLSPA